MHGGGTMARRTISLLGRIHAHSLPNGKCDLRSLGDISGFLGTMLSREN